MALYDLCFLFIFMDFTLKMFILIICKYQQQHAQVEWLVSGQITHACRYGLVNTNVLIQHFIHYIYQCYCVQIKQWPYHSQ